MRFAGYLRREKIDILQVYFLDSAFFGVVVARLAGVRHVLRVRNNLGYWIKPGQKSSYRAINNLFSFNLTNSDLGRNALVEQEGIDPVESGSWITASTSTGSPIRRRRQRDGQDRPGESEWWRTYVL